jgi:hypothetical protein
MLEYLSRRGENLEAVIHERRVRPALAAAHGRMAISKKAVGQVKRDARLLTFNFAREYRHTPHIADIGKIEMPPFMNGKFAAFLKISAFCGPSHSIPAIADRQRRAVELTVSSEKLDAHS